jgi:PAS domain S-box-containing protein
MSVVRRCAVAILWIAALVGPAMADAAAVLDLPSGHVSFRMFGSADGLRNLLILSLAQDRDGMLWIATGDGVYQFDGEHFTHFSVKDGLLTSAVTVVGTAPDGRVCVGSGNGLACFDGTRFSQAGTRGLPARSVLSLVSHAGKLWVGTAGGGLYVGDLIGGFAPAPGWVGVPATGVQALWADRDGMVVGNGASVGLTTGDGVWRDLGDIGLGSDRVENVVRARNGALWIRTSTGMWLLPRGTRRATDLHDGMPSARESSHAAGAMALDSRGEILIATDDGVTYRDHDRWRTLDAAAGIPRAVVRTLFVDREGTIWLGAAGLVQLRRRGELERHTMASGMPGEIVWTFKRDRHGQLLIGTNRCLAHAVAGNWTCVPGTEGRVVTSVVFPPQGGMFLGGAPSGLIYFDDGGHATTITVGDQPDVNVQALALDGEHDLWIGSWDGLYRLPGAVPGVVERIEVPGAVAGARFLSVLVVGDQLWVTASPGGLVVRDHGTWHWFGRPDGFRDTAMDVMVARSDGRLCTAYVESIGVTCFTYHDGTVGDLEHIDTTTGLNSDMVYFVGEDREHRLWVGTAQGVDVVTAQGVDHLDETDGLAGNDSSGNGFLLDSDGSLWLAASGGATHVFAQNYRGPPPPPEAAVLDGQLGDQRIRAGLHGTAPLEAPHDHSALTLELSAGTLLDPKRVELQVRMPPLETAWHTIHQRQIRYPSVVPGEYRFEVRARFDNGRWGPVAGLPLAVLPAWWQTGWCVALIASSAILVIGLGLAGRQRAVLRRRTRQLNDQSDANFRAVIDLMPDLIAMHRDRALIYLNRASCTLLGVERPDGCCRPRDLIDRIHSDDRPRAVAVFERMAALDPQGASEPIELRVCSAIGDWRTCEISSVCIEIGGAATVVASGRDVTERKRMNAKLMVSDRMSSLGTLAAGIAHEINNPLAYIAGNLEVVAELIQDADQLHRADTVSELSCAIKDAQDGAERVRKIVLGLRPFTRTSAEQYVALALPEVLEAAIQLTGNEVRHRAQLVQELGPTPLVRGDEGRLTQVFLNLLINAAQAIPEGRSSRNLITVRTRTDAQGNAIIEIEDTGKGMAPDVQIRVFDPFFTTKDVGEGTGLGLSICHGIVTAIGGQISIESPPNHRGSIAIGETAVAGTLVRVVLPPHATASTPGGANPDRDLARLEQRRRFQTKAAKVSCS